MFGSSLLTFCENVTPTTYTQTRHSLDHLEDLDLDALNELQASLLPGFEPNDPNATTKKRRGPPHRRRSQGHIPRPPNAFMMFRQNFCKSSRFRPGMTDERDSLSRLLGKEWRELPAEEKSYWDLIAKIEKERHKRLYPDYKYVTFSSS
ncbi:hypothetical protein L218DRAFT_859236 [Marasmius fiardii PR-910]|nr:hypothetical protein L218DRAFT_859236 [Marasmius fiardii PR-910]